MPPHADYDLYESGDIAYSFLYPQPQHRVYAGFFP